MKRIGLNRVFAVLIISLLVALHASCILNIPKLKPRPEVPTDTLCYRPSEWYAAKLQCSHVCNDSLREVIRRDSVCVFVFE